MSPAHNPTHLSADVAPFFKALADDTRLAIVRLLALTDMRAGEVAERLSLPQNAVSYHLGRLRELGLLRDRRGTHDARDVYYSLDGDRLRTPTSPPGARSTRRSRPKPARGRRPGARCPSR